MSSGIGIVLFAIGIGLTIALHEAGHMVAARAFSMRVRRFFIGFGPKIASFRKGQTEYGLAALPLGGFCDIAGMTANDEFLTREERPHALFAKPWWQRVIVLSGGVLVNLALGFLILVTVAQTAGLPNPKADMRPVVEEVVCPENPCAGLGPAGDAGIKPGDKIVSVEGQDIVAFTEVRDIAMARPGQTLDIGVERGGEIKHFRVPVATINRQNPGGESIQVGAVGIVQRPLDIIEKHSFIGAFPAAWNYSVFMLQQTARGIVEFPLKIPGVVASIFGGERDVEGPMSVVGASRVGGELVEANLWAGFFMMLASLNYFLALFNLIPLPPFDGGHIAVVLYEKIRDFIRRLRGLEPGPAADYTRLMPITYAIGAVLLTVGALIIIADVVNPIRLLG
ncbi:MAG: M50 family metallopeptidase [Corynebacterium sp.]|nr:M50 family metallopeptidase [Corynebacterium sp.]